ncbi:MAG: signal peptidase I [Propionibacteriaceae bacterium]|nr:signal peptidase I [Propionibacteriaceae bacterium]
MVASALTTCALFAAVILTVALVVVPKVTGGMSLTVLTGSMRPGINPGDVVVTRGVDTQQAASLNIGDVITFLPYPDDPTLVTHRIIAKSVGAAGVSFITQGDNNNVADSWGPVHDFQVRGNVLYVVPKVGWARQWVGQAGPWLVPGVGVLLIGVGIVSVVTSRRRPDEPDLDPDEEDPDDGGDAPPRRADWGAT